MTESDEQEYPSVNLAYSVSMDSYEWMGQRFDALDSKIQTVMAIAVTATYAVPVAFGALEIEAANGSVYAAMLFFASSIGLSIYARLLGAFRMISPSVLYEQWLGMSEWEFKKNAIFFAGQNFETNAKTIDRKYQFFQGAISCLALEAVCWVLSAI